MMLLHTFDFTLPAAYALLPTAMRDPRATAMLLAIGLKESGFEDRRQKNYGPARGFWQFEKTGVRGVMRHPDSRAHAIGVLRALRYSALLDKPADVHFAIHDNDVLACCFARLLLWTVPDALPTRDNAAAGFEQYLEGWRPGAVKPHNKAEHFKEWREHYARAWQVTTFTEETT